MPGKMASRSLLIPIPGSAEIGQQVTAEELAEKAAKILCEAPDAWRAVSRLKAEVDTWRFLPASVVEPKEAGDQ